MIKLFNSKNYIFTSLCVSLFAICIVSLMFGNTFYSFNSVLNTLLKHSSLPEVNFIIENVRLPRIFVGILSGALFALAGSLLQCALQNPMAAPDVLGVNSACSLFILIFSSIFENIISLNLIYYSVFGALVGFIVTLVCSMQNKKISQIRLIIVGVAMGTLFKACCQFFIMHSSDVKLSSFISFLSGTLHDSTWDIFKQIAIPSCLIIPCCIGLHKQLDILQLNDESAMSIGFNVSKWRIIVIFIALMAVGIAVTGAGGLGFIGLISPNISKILFGNSHKYNLIGSALIGSSLTIFADLIGRIIFHPYEVPAGLVTIIIGAPYFLYLMKNVNKYR